MFWSDMIEHLIILKRDIGRKKNTCGSGSRPTLFFSADPIIFSTRLTRATLFSPGGCGLLPKWRLLSH
jgi:hypothetical protein